MKVKKEDFVCKQVEEETALPEDMYLIHTSRPQQELWLLRIPKNARSTANINRKHILKHNLHLFMNVK